MRLRTFIDIHTPSAMRCSLINEILKPTLILLVASTGRTFSPTRPTPQGTPQSRTFSPTGPQTSTPNKESSARRCLPLMESSSRQQEICPANNCGRLRYVGTAPVDLMNLSHNEPPPRYAFAESGLESMPMMPGSSGYQVVPADQKNYQSVESAFMARTAVVSNVH